MVSQDWKKSLVTPVASLICLAGIALVQISSFSSIKANIVRTELSSLTQVEQEKASLKLLKNLPAFGYSNLIADWSFIRFLQYFGDSSSRKETGYNLSPKYFEIIVDRDPQFIESYKFLSTSVSLYAGQPEKSVALINQGLKSLSPELFPDAHYIWIYKATDQLLFLGDVQGAKQSYLMAASWASIHPDARSQALAHSAKQTLDFLDRNPSSRNARVNAWLLVLVSTFDQQTRQKAINNIEALGANVSFSDSGAVTVRFSERD
jgi:hypothetical protein